MLGMCLALCAGYLDGYGLLVLGTFVSFMSGNTTTAGVEIAQAQLQQAVPPAIAVASFVAGSFAGNLATSAWPHAAHRLLPGLVAVALVLDLPLQPESGSSNVSIAVLSFAMGMLNPTLTHIGGESVSLTFVTGTLSRIGHHLALAVSKVPVDAPQGAWDTHLYRVRIGLQLWSSLIGGAVLAGIAQTFMGRIALVPVTAVMVLLAFKGTRDDRRNR